MDAPVLQRILDCIRAKRPERPVVLLDLDGTLYDNRPRTLRILHAFAAQLGPAHHDDAEKLRAITYAQLLYRLEDTLPPLGIPAELVERACAAWRLRFFTDAACSDDIPMSGAVRFVRACWDLGATVVYLTGRDIPGMLLGTSRTLRDDGFPIAIPRVELVMKPAVDEGDTDFKLRLLEPLAELGQVVATFDNEPVNCNLFRKRWPEATSVFLDTLCAPGSPRIDAGIESIRSFDV